MRAGTYLVSASVWVSAWGPVEAEEAKPEIYQVEAAGDERHPGATRRTIDLESRAGEVSSVGESVEELPGVQTRAVGGLGSFTSVSIRGAAPDQVAIYYDGVPLNRGAFAVVDLSEFSAASLERIEVWSGLPPVDRMGAGLGGVIDLIPSRKMGAETRASGGSFGTRGALLRMAEQAGRHSLAVSTSYLGSEGNFAYLDHRGTLFDETDDRIVPRTNNHFDQVSGTLTLASESFLEMRLLQDIFYKAQGIPGPLTTTARASSLDTWRSITHLRLGRPGLLEAALYGTVDRHDFRDPLGEVGLGADDQTSRAWSVGGELRGAWAIGPTVLLLVPQVHHERYRQRDSSAAARLKVDRFVLGLGISDTIAIARDRLFLEPAFRFDRYLDSIDSGQDVSRTLISPRTGLRVRATPTFTITASGGRYHRTPTLLELFGDRGFVVGNPDLNAETGVATDAGVEWQGRAVRTRLQFHATRAQQLILLVQNSQQTLRPQNIGSATLLGTEATLSIVPLPHLLLQLNYAYLWPHNRLENRQLPGRATQEAFARTEIEAGKWGSIELRGFSDIEATSGMFFDTANLRRTRARIFWGAGITLEHRAQPSTSITLEGKNLLDDRSENMVIDPGSREATVALQDYLGYALPGRAFYATGRLVF